MIVNEVVIPLSEYCSVVGRIERHGPLYSATLSWRGEFFAGEEIIRRKWKADSYEEALDSLKSMVSFLEGCILGLDNAVVRFSEGDNH